MKKNRTQTALISILILMTLVLSACGGQGSAHLKENSAGGSNAPADFSDLKKTGSDPWTGSTQSASPSTIMREGSL